jgi:hypothetical protein
MGSDLYVLSLKWEGGGSEDVSVVGFVVAESSKEESKEGLRCMFMRLLAVSGGNTSTVT